MSLEIPPTEEDLAPEEHGAPAKVDGGEAPGSRAVFTLALGMILFGMVTLFLVGVAEALWLRQIPWGAAVMVIGDAAPPDGVKRVTLRSVPPPDQAYLSEIQHYLSEQFATDAAVEEVAEAVEEQMLEGGGAAGADAADAPDDPPADPLFSGTLPYSFSEHVMQVKLRDETWQAMLGSGRVPEPGKPEVLAGALVRQRQIELDGVIFEVVGTLRRGVGAADLTYLLPRHENWRGLFQKNAAAERGWVDPSGLERLADIVGAEDFPEDARVIFGARTDPLFIFFGVLALLIIVFGGIIAHTQLFWVLAERDTGILRPVFAATRAWPRLFFLCHVVYYGVFFMAMYQGIMQPVWSMRVTESIGQAFTDGDLAYIGEAYGSGNYIRAAAATWWNNYIYQTLLMTFAASAVPLGFGLLKTGFSFALVGFAMPPAHVGTAAGYSYHSLTMILELEAYIVACFAVILWTLHFYRAVFLPDPWRELKTGAGVFLSAVVLTGVMLAIAGLYEAVSLITFSML